MLGLASASGGDVSRTTSKLQQERIEVSSPQRVASLRGIVVAPDDSPLADVEVKVFRNDQKRVNGRRVWQQGREVVFTYTKARGAFLFRKLPAGPYRVEFFHRGFDPVIYSNVVINPTAHRRGWMHVEMKIAM